MFESVYASNLLGTYNNVLTLVDNNRLMLDVGMLIFISNNSLLDLL